MINSLNSSPESLLQTYLDPTHVGEWTEGILTFPFSHTSSFLEANARYFSHPDWAKAYFEACHRDAAFRDRWLAATGGWDDKIVVDVGCGPGNLYATLGGKPRLLIGVDVAPGSLKMAQELGYTPVLADAHKLPFISGFADIVALNATLHHCDDMDKVLREAARLVRPGGLLIIDHDPQLTAWNFKGLGMAFYNIRLIVYRLLIRELHVPKEDRMSALDTETHHKPGDGVTSELFLQTLESLGFSVKLYPHNNAAGSEVFQGKSGNPPHWRYRLGQRLSGIDPNTPEAALSLMCLATRP